MGMFTSVIKDGVSLQFKIGGDRYDTYHIGDTVPWSKGPELGMGKFLDSVTEENYDDLPEYWLIIKDHKIFNAVPYAEGSQEFLEEKYSIKPYERSWWTDEECLMKDAKDAEYTLNLIKNYLDFLKSTTGHTLEKRKEAVKEEILSKGNYAPESFFVFETLERFYQPGNSYSGKGWRDYRRELIQRSLLKYLIWGSAYCSSY
jgi:hypothetical protein